MSWIAVALSAIIALAGLVFTGELIEQYPDSSIGLPDAYTGVGLCLLGVVFLGGSFAALRNRRRAGWLFVICAPVLSFILAYPAAGSWANGLGGAYYDLPALPAAITLACIFFAPFYGPLIAIRIRKRAAYVFLVFATVLGLAVWVREQAHLLLLPLAAWWGLFLGFGAFWLGTYKLGWPDLFPAVRRSPIRRVSVALLVCLLIVVTDLSATFTRAAMRSTLWMPGCSGSLPFTHPTHPGHVVLTARLIRTAHTAMVSGRWAGDWAIGVVQESFWGLPAWTPHLVLLTNGIYWEGHTYFVSGSRQQGLLTHLLPIVDATPCGSHVAGPVADVETFLRVLRSRGSPSDISIIGYVLSPKRPSAPMKSPETNIYERTLNGWERYSRLAGVRVKVTGRSASQIATTDAKGIYEVSGLSPGDYTVSLLDPPAGQTASDRELDKQSFIPGRPLPLNLVLYWKTSDEGAAR